MPTDACLRDDILRDTWLRKMISSSWNDKELFYKWRSSNDSNTESQKKKFVQQVDQFSNVEGGLAGNLERQLKLHTEWKRVKDERKKAGQPPPKFPDDIKPHLYEEIIEYSIKNGKMSMEQKMFYIVQGVASGLLPIERLRALAGQHGSIIQIFPYIEYFYAHNNSLPEIEKLAQRLREGSSGSPESFRPGVRTTLWVNLEVARDEQVRRRLSKGSTRTAEGIDHEDIPFFITQMDWGEVRNLLDVISGSRQKVTPEGLKNAYVGFNSKMKIFGSLARLENKERTERFTKTDAEVMAKNLASYIFFDNAVAMNGVPGKERPPYLTLSQFKTQPPSGVGGNTAWDYRVKMTTFLQQLNRAGIFNGLNWKTGAAGEEKQDSNLGVTKEQMLAIDESDTKNYGYRRNPDGVPILDRLVFSKFAEQLEQAIMNNMDAFKRVLDENADTFLNEGGSDQMNYETIKRIRAEQEASIKLAAGGTRP